MPAVAPAGATDVIVAAERVAAETVKGNAFDATPALETVIDTEPAAAISAAEMAAVNCVALTNVVARADPFQFTTEPFTKFVPVTVSVNPEVPHDGMEFVTVVGDDETEVIAGETIVNGIPLDVPPPLPGFCTFTCAVPAARKSEAGIVAVSCVELT